MCIAMKVQLNLHISCTCFVFIHRACVRVCVHICTYTIYILYSIKLTPGYRERLVTGA